MITGLPMMEVFSSSTMVCGAAAAGDLVSSSLSLSLSLCLSLSLSVSLTMVCGVAVAGNLVGSSLSLSLSHSQWSVGCQRQGAV